MLNQEPSTEEYSEVENVPHSVGQTLVGKAMLATFQSAKSYHEKSADHQILEEATCELVMHYFYLFCLQFHTLGGVSNPLKVIKGKIAFCILFPCDVTFFLP